MKKEKKQPLPKEGNFSHNPFKSLKGIEAKPATDSKKPVSPPPATEPPPAVDDDLTLFLREVADVRRMDENTKTSGKAVPSKPPVVQRIDDSERKVFLKALEKLEMDVVFQDELPDDVEPLRPLNQNRLRQLRRGTIRIDFQLDLHGLTRDEAVESLARFVTGAYNRAQKAVLVITGKGNNSSGEPVLQAAVAGWLRDKGKEMVAEFAPAPRQMGGSGAFVVFLKDKVRVQK
ncbi:Smr domain protein [Geotalea daltonii FRC-32]|uniref:Smr domain protein n=1 Tax=Geotalea daltonii (strain DSM 22248 / JCM 15807 / FRC-32) TaxID=316067 RepID=B9M4P6_GEODF|nr:Smr/MutS family protein [Geotalea daltonii]ACM19772.1 Smr domain protein [Geotalea daltonii FRC-32]